MIIQLTLLENVIMDTLIIKPKDKAELNFFLELAKRIGAEVQTYDDIQDEQLLKAMEANEDTPKIDRKEVFDILNTQLHTVTGKVNIE